MTENNNESTDSRNEKRFTLAYSDDSEKSKWWAVRDEDITLWKEEVVYLLNQLHEENEQLRETLKNLYINEICENCKYGHYFLDEIYGYGFEGNFECKKKHFGNDHWKCDGLTECDDFELRLKGDDEE